MTTTSRFISIGAQAPDFILPAISGEDVSLSDYRGKKNVALIFLRGFM